MRTQKGFGSLIYIREQPWRLRYLTIEELAVLMHEAEREVDDMSVIAIADAVRERNIDELFQREYMRVWSECQKGLGK